MKLDTRMKAETHADCYSALKEDRACGLIYGPYGIEHADGTIEHVHSHVFAAATGRCTYCAQDLPRGRRRLLLARFVPARLAQAVALAWAR